MLEFGPGNFPQRPAVSKIPITKSNAPQGLPIDEVLDTTSIKPHSGPSTDIVPCPDHIPIPRHDGFISPDIMRIWMVKNPSVSPIEPGQY